MTSLFTCFYDSSVAVQIGITREQSDFQPFGIVNFFVVFFCNFLRGSIAKQKTTVGIDQDFSFHGFTSQKHAIPHGISVGKSNFYVPNFLTNFQWSSDDISTLSISTRTFDDSSVNDLSFTVYYLFPVELQWMYIKGNPTFTIALKGEDVDCMYCRGFGTTIYAYFDQRNF